MPTNHTILELRTGRDAEHTPESAAHLFSTLPELKNSIFDKILGQDEHLSFELFVRNQTIYFTCYCPDRLVEYLKAAISAAYSQVMITEIEGDPFLHFYPSPKDHQSGYYQERYLELGKIELNQSQYYSLKTYEDFKDVDPLVTLLSNLSKAQPMDLISIQYIVDNDSGRWKQGGWQQIEQQSSNEEQKSPSKYTSSEKALIEKKLKIKSLHAAIKIAVSTVNQNRSHLLLETIATAFNSISQSRGNSLKLNRIRLLKQHFLDTMKHRSFARAGRMHLSVDELGTICHLPNEKLSVIPNIAWGKSLLGEPPEDLPVVDGNTPDEVKNKINVFAETTFKNQEVKYGLQNKDRRRHMYVIGKTGTGKSTLLANMAINDLKNNEGLAVIDPHGDLIEIMLDYIPSHRINDVIYFNPADKNDRIVKMNLFEGENVEHRELIASGIISIFHKLYGYSWGPRLEYILRNALLTLLSAPHAKLSDVIRILTDKKFRSKIVSNLDDPILKSYWLDEYNQLGQRLRSRSISSILNKIGQFVASPLVRDVVNAQKSSFSIEQLMSEGKILLANLSQGKLGEDNATLLGAMLITKIQLAAMGRVNTPEEKRRDFYMYVDEFQNFATDSFIKILSEARKYRLNLTLANQYVAQIPEEVQKAIFGNCGNIVSFVMGADDAEAFAKEYGGLYTKEDLVSLGRYQIINKISIDNVISRPFPAHTLPLLSNTNKNRDKVIRVSRERYAK
jgi:hypothetical protein